MPVTTRCLSNVPQAAVQEDGHILGAQAVGLEGVDKRIDVIATAIQAGLTVYDLEELELAYAPPWIRPARSISPGLVQVTHCAVTSN